jgi:hypothetical protein
MSRKSERRDMGRFQNMTPMGRLASIATATLLIAMSSGVALAHPRTVSITGLHVGTDEFAPDHPSCPAELRNAPLSVEVKMRRYRTSPDTVRARALMSMRFADSSQSRIELRTAIARRSSWQTSFADRCPRPTDGEGLRLCMRASAGGFGATDRLTLRLVRDSNNRFRLRLYTYGLISQSQQTDLNGNSYTSYDYITCSAHHFAVLL